MAREGSRRHEGQNIRDFHKRAALRQQPDRLEILGLDCIAGSPNPLPQLRDAQMSDNRCHDRPLRRIMAIDLIRFESSRESSSSESITRIQ